MKAINLMRMFLVALTVVGATTTHADENGGNLIYVGAGPAKKADSTTTGSTPMSLGYLRLSNATNFVWGLDVSGEGTMLDSTWGKNNAVKQAMSYNLLVGTNFKNDGGSRIDGAVLLGAREASANCPSSFIGYQCYANSAPTTNHKLNYGVVLTWSFKSFMVGLRATEASTQALIGLRF